MYVYITIIVILIIIVIIFYFRNEKINRNNKIIDSFLYNKSYADFTILDILKNVSEKYPDKIALKIKKEKNKWTSISYYNYYDNIKNFAQNIYNQFGENINIAIIGSNSPAWYYSHLGCMMNGGFSVPISKYKSLEETIHMIRETNINILVVENEEQLNRFINIDMTPVKLIIYYSVIDDLEIIKKFNIPVVSIGNFAVNKNIKLNNPKCSNISTIIYTNNGTGISLTHKNIMKTLHKFIGNVVDNNISLDNETFIGCQALDSYIGQIFDIYLPILTVGSLWFSNKNINDIMFVKNIKQIRPTILIGAPIMWRNLLSQIHNNNNYKIYDKIKNIFNSKLYLSHIGLNKLKLSFNTFDYISDGIIKKFESYGLNIGNIYTNEYAGIIGMSIKKQEIEKLFVKTKITDRGELYISGITVSNVLNNNKNLTENGWIKTNDIVGHDNENKLLIICKKNNIVKDSNGCIYLDQIVNYFKDLLGEYFEYIYIKMNDNKYKIYFNTYFKYPQNIETIISNYINKFNNKKEYNIIIDKWKIVRHNLEINNELKTTLCIK